MLPPQLAADTVAPPKVAKGPLEEVVAAERKNLEVLGRMMVEVELNMAVVVTAS